MAHTLRRVGTHVGLLFACVALSASCGGSPTTASGSPVTDAHDGTLTTANNFAIYSFTTSSGGNVTVTLVSLSQPVSIEVSLGIESSGACSLQFSQPSFTTGEQWQNSLSGAGTYCLEVDDVATPNPPASLDYSLSILHPS